jgi:hypothetical protein
LALHVWRRPEESFSFLDSTVHTLSGKVCEKVLMCVKTPCNDDADRYLGMQQRRMVIPAPLDITERPSAGRRPPTG